MGNHHANDEPPKVSANSRHSIAAQQRTALRIAIVGSSSLFLLSLWLADWTVGALYVLFCFGVLISHTLGGRIAVGASRLWAVPVGLGMSGATLLLLLCTRWVTGGDRTSGGLPISWFAFAGATGAYFLLNTLWAARMTRHQTRAAETIPRSSARSPDALD